MTCTEYLAEIFVECSVMWAEVVEAEPVPRWGWIYLAAFGLLVALGADAMHTRYKKERTR
jgi:hypothetical protein